jgi:ABC-2 type transport system permease protein
VAWKEIHIYFSSPTAYIVGMIFLGGTGAFFTLPLIRGSFPEATLGSFLQGYTIIMILLAPILTMRLLAEEQKLGTIELLLTAPVRDWEVVVGKYLASLVFLLGMVALTLYYPLLLFVFADPDPGPIYSGYLGLILYGGASLAVGLLTSTLTSNQIIAAVVAMGILLLLYLLGSVFNVEGGILATVLSAAGLKSNFDDFDRGVIDTKHIVYYLSLTAVFLFLSIRALEARRWR